MIRRLLINIRRKPKHVRDNYALGIASSITAVVALVWLYHWPSTAAERLANDTDSVPLSDLMGEAVEQVGAARESLGDLDRQVDSTPSPQPNFVEQAVSTMSTGTQAAAAVLPIRLSTSSASTSQTVVE